MYDAFMGRVKPKEHMIVACVFAIITAIKRALKLQWH